MACPMSQRKPQQAMGKSTPDTQQTYGQGGKHDMLETKSLEAEFRQVPLWLGVFALVVTGLPQLQLMLQFNCKG